MKPYSKSQASPEAAERRIKKMLKEFGVQMVSITDDYEHKTILVIFKYQDMPVKIPLTYGVLADKWIEETPHTFRHRKSRQEHEDEIRDTAYRAAFSMLEDLLKPLITMAEMGLRPFETSFLADLVMDGEQRLVEIMLPKIRALTKGEAPC